jgi:hypothetical protein
LTDLKELFKSNQSERQQKIEKLKEKTDNIIDEDDECDPLDTAVVSIIPDHNYCEIQKATAKECVIYYIICSCFMGCQIVLKKNYMFELCFCFKRYVYIRIKYISLIVVYYKIYDKIRYIFYFLLCCV